MIGRTRIVCTKHRILYDKAQSRFTLVELLVVLAVLTILVGLLLPALREAIETAHHVSCMNNSKQLALGVMSYSEENNRYFPCGDPGVGKWPWHVEEHITGNPVIGNFNDINSQASNIWWCPSTYAIDNDSLKDNYSNAENGNPLFNTSYGCDDRRFLGISGSTRLDLQKLSHYKNPSGKLLLTETCKHDGNAKISGLDEYGDDFIMSRRNGSVTTFSNGNRSPVNDWVRIFPLGDLPHRHNEANVTLFMDGHVDSILIIDNANELMKRD